MPDPPYRIRTEQLLLRCWDPSDAPALSAAIAESLDHLRRWMAWAHQEPQSVEARADLLRRFRADFDLGRDLVFGIFDPEESVVLGGAGLHLRSNDTSREIGYWIHADHTGKGYATEASAALVRVAFEILEVPRVEIHCDPANTRSAAVPRRLGFTHDGTLRRRGLTADGEPRDDMIWSLFADEHPESAAAGFEVRAFDVLDRRIL